MNPFDPYIADARQKLAQATTAKARRFARAELLSWLTHATIHRDGHTCQYCGVETNTIPGHPRQRTLDHVVPVSAGGADDLENVVLACRSCNSRKGARPVSAYARTTREAGR